MGETEPVPKTTKENEIQARIRAHIRQQMDERGITQEELVRLLGTDSGNFSRILSGQRGIGSLALVERISEVLRITETRLFHDNPPKRYWEEGSHPNGG